MSNEPLDSDQPDETTPLEQLARRFETYADDNEALMARRGILTATDKREVMTKVHTWREMAKEMRELELDLMSKGFKVVVTSIVANDDGSVD